jgi:hypothetical protein
MSQLHAKQAANHLAADGHYGELPVFSVLAR